MRYIASTSRRGSGSRSSTLLESRWATTARSGRREWYQPRDRTKMEAGLRRRVGLTGRSGTCTPEFLEHPYRSALAVERQNAAPQRTRVRTHVRRHEDRCSGSVTEADRVVIMTALRHLVIRCFTARHLGREPVSQARYTRRKKMSTRRRGTCAASLLHPAFHDTRTASTRAFFDRAIRSAV